jgi:hypothetical protein
LFTGGAVAQLGARLDGIEEVVGSNPIGSTKEFLRDMAVVSASRLKPGRLWVRILSAPPKFLRSIPAEKVYSTKMVSILRTWGAAVLRPYIFCGTAGAI